MEDEKLDSGAVEGTFVSKEGNIPQVHADVTAQINQFTERPDLLINALEKHDPGFIKYMNGVAKRGCKQNCVTSF